MPSAHLLHTTAYSNASQRSALQADSSSWVRLKPIMLRRKSMPPGSVCTVCIQYDSFHMKLESRQSQRTYTDFRNKCGTTIKSKMGPLRGERGSDWGESRRASELSWVLSHLQNSGGLQPPALLLLLPSSVLLLPGRHHSPAQTVQ